MSEKVVWQLLQPYATAAGVPGIAPHDPRRYAAKMCRAAGGELEQIQLLLGHASVQTIERYLGTKQDLVHAPNDGIKLRVVQGGNSQRKASNAAGTPVTSCSNRIRVIPLRDQVPFIQPQYQFATGLLVE
jgi:hypothetical protein